MRFFNIAFFSSLFLSSCLFLSSEEEKKNNGVFRNNGTNNRLNNVSTTTNNSTSGVSNNRKTSNNATTSATNTSTNNATNQTTTGTTTPRSTMITDIDISRAGNGFAIARAYTDRVEVNRYNLQGIVEGDTWIIDTPSEHISVAALRQNAVLRVLVALDDEIWSCEEGAECKSLQEFSGAREIEVASDGGQARLLVIYPAKIEFVKYIRDSFQSSPNIGFFTRPHILSTALGFISSAIQGESGGRGTLVNFNEDGFVDTCHSAPSNARGIARLDLGFLGGIKTLNGYINNAATGVVRFCHDQEKDEIKGTRMEEIYDIDHFPIAAKGTVTIAQFEDSFEIHQTVNDGNGLKEINFDEFTKTSVRKFQIAGNAGYYLAVFLLEDDTIEFRFNSSPF